MIVGKIRPALEFIICFFSGHDFTISLGYGQQLECHRCNQPYRETLQDKLQQRLHRSRAAHHQDNK
jgi:hypothetical protein